MKRGCSLDSHIKCLKKNSDDYTAYLLLFQEAYLSAEQRGDKIQSGQIKQLYEDLVSPEIAQIISEKRNNCTHYLEILDTLANHVLQISDRAELARR